MCLLQVLCTVTNLKIEKRQKRSVSGKDKKDAKGEMGSLIIKQERREKKRDNEKDARSLKEAKKQSKQQSELPSSSMLRRKREVERDERVLGRL